MCSPFDRTASLSVSDSSVVETWISTPAPCELPRRVLAQLRRDLGQDLRSRVDEHPALSRLAEARVEAHCVGDEIGELGKRLDPRVAGTDEDERQVCLAADRIELGVGSLELSQDVVAEIDRVGEVLEPDRVLGEPGNRERPSDGAERKHEMLPGDVERAGLRRLDVRRPLLRIDRRHAAQQHLGVRAHLTQRHDHMPRLERA